MNIVISSASEAPIYQQVYDQISGQIIRGELPSHFCLPPIRNIAKELRISVITIKRAWEELERDGFIYAMVGKGCFVSPMTPQKLVRKRDDIASEKIKKDLEFYRELGLSLSEIIDLIRDHY